MSCSKAIATEKTLKQKRGCRTEKKKQKKKTKKTQKIAKHAVLFSLGLCAGLLGSELFTQRPSLVRADGGWLKLLVFVDLFLKCASAADGPKHKHNKQHKAQSQKHTPHLLTAGSHHPSKEFALFRVTCDDTKAASLDWGVLLCTFFPAALFVLCCPDHPNTQTNQTKPKHAPKHVTMLSVSEPPCSVIPCQGQHTHTQTHTRKPPARALYQRCSLLSCIHAPKHTTNKTSQATQKEQAEIHRLVVDASA